jgi:hypothetical protein
MVGITKRDPLASLAHSNAGCENIPVSVVRSRSGGIKSEKRLQMLNPITVRRPITTQLFPVTPLLHYGKCGSHHTLTTIPQSGLAQGPRSGQAWCAPPLAQLRRGCDPRGDHNNDVLDIGTHAVEKPRDATA